MSIIYKILGKAGHDNALFLQINSGNRYYRILFDCGEGIPESLDNTSLRNIDYLCFSHLHMDHISGFDYFFRRNYNREKPVQISGPEKTIEIIQNRLRGFTWNWVDDLPGEWIVNEISEFKFTRSIFLTKNAFAGKDLVVRERRNNIIFENRDFKIEAVLLNHSVPSIGYRVSEKFFFNIDEKMLDEMKLPRGAWLEDLRNPEFEENNIIEINNSKFSVKELRQKLIIRTEGSSISYLTDFIFDDISKVNAVTLIEGCRTVVCESQYLNKDSQFAVKNFHLTTGQAAELAKTAGVEKLYLFHISDRYKIEEDYSKILNEARVVFPNTFFPDHWNL